MSKMIPEVIRYRHIRNVEQDYEALKLMGETRFGKDFLGFIEEITFIHSEGYITKKIQPISGTPAKKFRETAKKAGLIGKKFDFNKDGTFSELPAVGGKK